MRDGRSSKIPELYVNVDESGTPGRKQTGKSHYIVAGCLVSDREGFEAATELRHDDRELKFHDDKDIRKQIIEDALPYVMAVYYVEYCKSSSWHLDGSKNDIVNLHKSLLQSLARGISHDNPGTYIRFVLDHNNLIDDTEARKIVTSQAGENVFISASVADSSTDFGLMTNDFFVGAIGYMLNTTYNEKVKRGEYIYTDLFKDKLVKLPCRFFDEKQVSRNVGNPRRRDTATTGTTPRFASRIRFWKRDEPSSCRVQTTFPSEEGVRSHTTGTASERPLQETHIRRDTATTWATLSSYGVRTTFPSKEGVRSRTTGTLSASAYKTPGAGILSTGGKT